MIKRVNHIAVAVPDLERARSTYEKLGVQVTAPMDLPEHGVRVSFVKFENLDLELMEALGDASPIRHFMGKNPSGAMHHICFEVDGLGPVTAALKDSGIRILGSGGPKLGAHGNPVMFAHPLDLFGVLTEFEEVLNRH